MTEDQDRKIAELAHAAEEIIAGLNHLNRDAGGQLSSLTIRAKRNRMLIWGLWAVSLAIIVLTAFVANLTFKVDEAQKLTRSQVLCPLYQQFINADTPKARVIAQKLGQDLKARDEAFKVIHHSYDVLGCANER